MSRYYDDMNEEQARQELERRNLPRSGDRYDQDGRWMNQVGYGPAAMSGPFGAPFSMGFHREAGYGPYATPRDVGFRGNRQGDRFGLGDRNRRQFDDGERGFMDRAGDEVASWFGDDEAEARREADHSGRGPKGYVRSDARIEDDVHDRLTDDGYVDAREISVSVKDREITLDGTVDSRQAKRRAEDCADSVSGVAHVQNNLRVQTAI